ncbi:MAG: imidazole glycerol phosphate synthase subunit HisH [Bryobacterales bacterium]|nr:imidazole glycerol phosphate synthase subunit HisH [Bryobacterales bacterium]
MIAVLDYGAGNLRSVANTLEEVGAPYELVRDADGLRDPSKLILPGVGHFGQMIRALDAMQVRGPLLNLILKGVPFLGICLGLQALFTGSEEAPGLAGLGLYAGAVRRFPLTARVPHMGWSNLEPVRPSRLLAGLGPQPHMYFAHSYYAPVIDATAAACTYEVSYTAVLECGNVFGVQFHPEKSGDLGLQIMRNFVEL